MSQLSHVGETHRLLSTFAICDRTCTQLWSNPYLYHSFPNNTCKRLELKDPRYKETFLKPFQMISRMDYSTYFRCFKSTFYRFVLKLFYSLHICTQILLNCAHVFQAAQIVDLAASENRVFLCLHSPLSNAKNLFWGCKMYKCTVPNCRLGRGCKTYSSL